MSAGRLIAVVGPSGVGKDSVIGGIVANRPAVHLVRRTITRAPGLGGEEYTAVTPEAFARAVDAGEFCLHWEAHGLCYGIPASVGPILAGGRDCLANLSRGALGEAAKVFPRLLVLNLTANPEILAQRLAGRGRETAEEAARRLDRAAKALPDGLDVRTIANDGPLAETVSTALAALEASGPFDTTKDAPQNECTI